MRIWFLFKYIQVLLLFPLLLSGLVFFSCNRSAEDRIVMPPATHPLARDYIGYGVVNISFSHLLKEPDPAGVSQGYLRRGNVVRIIERRQVIIRGITESWVLVEGNYQTDTAGQGTPVQGWLQESTLEIYENESMANTASRAMRL